MVKLSTILSLKEDIWGLVIGPNISWLQRRRFIREVSPSHNEDTTPLYLEEIIHELIFDLWSHGKNKSWMGLREIKKNRESHTGDVNRAQLSLAKANPSSAWNKMHRPELDPNPNSSPMPFTWTQPDLINRTSSRVWACPKLTTQ